MWKSRRNKEQWLPGLRVPRDHVFPSRLSSPGKHGCAGLVSTLIPLSCLVPLDWHLCWAEQAVGEGGAG